MIHWRVLTTVSLAATLAACSSGDITLAPTNIDNSTGGGGGSSGGATNPCASYSVGGTTRRGAFDGTNCTYDAAFVSAAKAGSPRSQPTPNRPARPADASRMRRSIMVVSVQPRTDSTESDTGRPGQSYTDVSGMFSRSCEVVSGSILAFSP